MIHVFKKNYPNAGVVPRRGGDILITMDFDENTTPAEKTPEDQ